VITIERDAAYPALTLLAICLGYFMTILDASAVVVALPSIEQTFSTSVTGLQWIVDGYLVIFAGFLLTGGALGDRLGSRRVFLVGLTLFTVASAMCGAAPSLAALQATRVVQGLGAAMMVPTSLALLRHSYSEPAERARMLGIWSGIAGTAAAAGPVIGALLITSFGWRSIFLLNVPVGILAFIFVRRFVTPPPVNTERRLDLPAQALAVAALVLLTTSFIEGGERGLSTPILAAGILAMVVAAMFVAVERRQSRPMLPLGLFTSGAFSGGVVVGLLINFAIFGEVFLMSLFFQQSRGYSVLMTGLAFLPQTVTIALVSLVAGRATARLGSRLPMLIGLITGGIGFLAMAIVDSGTPYLLLTLPLIAIGFGMAFTIPALTAAVLEAAPATHAGVASGALNATRQSGAAFGVAILGAIGGNAVAVGSGLHLALALAGAAFLLGSVLTTLTIRGG
jgi:DHA2 family methylenomycin A resistance protein-like MFS transporter